MGTLLKVLGGAVIGSVVVGIAGRCLDRNADRFKNAFSKKKKSRKGSK